MVEAAAGRPVEPHGVEVGPPEAESEPEEATLETPRKLARIEVAWRRVWPLDKPPATLPQPLDADDAWEEDTAERWLAFLEREPAALPVVVDPVYSFAFTFENFDDPPNLTFQSSTGTLTEVANPDPSGVNTSASSGEYVRDSAEQYDVLFYGVAAIADGSDYVAERSRFSMDVQ